MATIYTVGTGKTYSTIQAAINAIPGDLLGQGEQQVQVFLSSGDYGHVDAESGFTNTSATDFIRIIAMVSHRGKSNDGIRIVRTATGNDPFCLKTIAFTQVEGFVMEYNGPATSLRLIMCRIGSGGTLKNCILFSTPEHNSTQSWTGVEIKIIDGTEVNLWNNFIYHIVNNGTGGAYGISTFNSSLHKIFNNTVAGITGSNSIAYRVKFALPGALLENNYADGTLGFNYDMTDTTANNNVSSDASADDAGGTGHLINKAAANQFIDTTIGSENLHLKIGSDLVDSGKDLSSIFTTDIDGGTREIPWDIGADDAAAGVPGGLPTFGSFSQFFDGE